jgi:hypothetical protein
VLSRTRFLAPALCVAFVLAGSGCSRSSPPAGPSPEAAPRSAWSRILDEVGDDGTVGVATALKAFAFAIHPLPGVATPSDEPAGRVASGTVAVRWLLAHWTTLSAQQRTVAARALGGSIDESARGLRPAALGGAALGRAAPTPSPGRTGNPALLCQAADAGDAAWYRQRGDAAVPELARRWGRGLSAGFKVFYAVNTAQDGRALMYAVPCRGTRQVGGRGPITVCTIHVNPSAATQLAGDAARRATLIHELAHCFLYDRFGGAYLSLPNWYVEGAPTWVESVLGGVELDATDWGNYLVRPQVPLYRRSYDAVGFYAHLAQTGTDPWRRIDRIGAALIATSGAGRNRAGWDAAGVTSAFLDSWGPSFAKGAYPGKQWNIVGPGIPDIMSPIPARALGNGATVTVEAPAAAAGLVEIRPTAEVLEVAPAASATGRFAVGVGVDMSLEEAAAVAFCAKPGGCECPEGTEGSGTTFTTLAGGPNYLGVTGGHQAASVAVVGSSLTEFCRRKRTVCLVGDWVSDSSTFTLHGGTATGYAGARMRIDKSGSLTLDLDGMGPVVFTMPGAYDTTVRYTGRVTATVVMPSPGATSGTWRVTAGDYGDVLGTARVSGPFAVTVGPVSLRELASIGGGGASGAPFQAQRWTCERDQLTLSPPTGSPLAGVWRMHRAG